MTIGDKIRDYKTTVKREAAKVSVLSSMKSNKYEQISPSAQNEMKKQS